MAFAARENDQVVLGKDLTDAIVIGFGMTAYLAMLALRGIAESNDDRVDLNPAPTEAATDDRREAQP